VERVVRFAAADLAMVMLSELRRMRLLDDQRRRARLVDLVVDLSTADYPPVTRVLFRDGRGKQMALPWEAVTDIRWRLAHIRVTDLATARAAPPESLARSVLLVRDIMDALVLDVVERHAMRANDLWLRLEDGRLWLRAADVSPWAVLRRLGRGLLGRGGERHLVDWGDIEFLRGNPRAAQAGGDYHRRITRLTPPAIARLAAEVPYHHAAELLTLIPDAVAADTLETMAPERQLQVFEDLDEDQAVRLLALMAPDLATDLVGRLQPAYAQRCLESLPPARAARIIELLRYPEDSAGGLMTNEFPVVAAQLTVAQARAALRDALSTPDFAYYVYVVDDLDSHHLEGVVTLRDLIVASDDAPLCEVMRRQLLTIDALDSALAAAWQVIEQHLAALPVVARDGRLLGVVTVDAAVAQVAPVPWRQDAPRLFS
jgi:CBS domain-containing protein